jgi:hypothetical protein
VLDRGKTVMLNRTLPEYSTTCNDKAEL